MPQIFALRPTAVAGVDLGHGVFQVSYGASLFDRIPAFSLLFRYPPATTALFRPADSLLHTLPAAQTVLVQAPISLATEEGEMERVCGAAREGGSEDTDIRRAREALEMFRNKSARISDATLQTCVEDVAAVIRTYWALRAWIAGGMNEARNISTVTSFAQKEGQRLEHTLVCRP